MTTDIVVSSFDNISDTIPKYLAFSGWPHLATWLTQPHAIREWKDGPGWSGSLFDGKGRSDENVTATNVAVLDFDHMTEDSLARIEERLQHFAYALYTSHRHMTVEQGIAFRLVMPVSRAIQPSEYNAFYLRLIDVMGGEADTTCQNPSRVFYLPSCPAEREKHAFSTWQDGAVLDVSAVLGRPSVAPERKPGFGGMVNEELIKSYAQKLRAKADPLSNAIGYAIQLALRGERFAPDGERDNALFALACSLAEAFPDADSAVIAQYFAPSISLMRENGEGPTTEIFAEKIARKQREYRVSKNAPADDRARRILALYRNGRDYGYTAEELQSWGDMSHRWILTRGNDLWFFVHGEYVHLPHGPYTETASLDYLAPATGIPLVRPTKEGFAMVPIRELCMLHGTALDKVSASLLQQRTIYDPQKRSLIEATAPRADIGEPAYDPRIQTWLEALLGEPGLDWLAVVPKLQEAAPALFLSGAPGVGKSLLANGIAKLWQAGRPTSLEDVLGTPFNDALARCPLVFGDENIPKEHGRPKIEDLKRLITSTRHRLARKFRDVMDLEGAARVILAANDPSVVFGRAALTQEDIAAAMDRFVYVAPHKEARRIVSDVPKSMLFQWVEGGAIARHVLWLAQHRTVDGTGRLACPAHLGEMKDRLTIATGLRWEILDWITSYLANPALITPELLKIKNLAPPVHISGAGTLWIRGETIFHYWDKYGDSKRVPEKRKILDEIGHMCPNRGTFNRAHYRALDLEILHTWCNTADKEVADLNKFREWGKKSMLF